MFECLPLRGGDPRLGGDPLRGGEPLLGGDPRLGGEPLLGGDPPPRLQPPASLRPSSLQSAIREGIKKIDFFLGKSPKQRTPPTHRYGLGLT